MADAYGDIGSECYRASFAEAEAIVEGVEATADRPVAATEIQAALDCYDRAVTIITSLASFVKCLGAKASTDERTGEAAGAIADHRARLAAAAEPIFAAIDALDPDEPLWRMPPLSDWAFVVKERRSHWKRRLSPTDRDCFNRFEARCFEPLGQVFKTLQKGVDFATVNAKGEEERIRAA